LLILGAVIFSAAGLAILSRIVGIGPTVRDGSVLVVRLRGTLDEVEPGGVLRPFLPARPTIRSLTETLRGAQTDPRIVGLIVVPNETPALWGKVQELREAVRRFRTSGKPTVAFLEYGGDHEYYLATACQRIFLLPTSTLNVNGLASYELFLRGTLDKVGVYPDLLHVGDYKTAVNTWARDGFTPAHREMAESLNQDAFDELVRAVAESRRRTEDEIHAAIDAGPFLPEDALHEGLIDDLAYEDQLDDKVRFGRPDVHLLEAEDYARARPRGRRLTPAPRIGVIYAVGTIASGESQDLPEGPVLGAESIVSTIRTARGDPSIQAIVLRIDSPGGSSIASDVIWRELMLTRAQKPLIVSMSDVAGSGGYYIALPAHHIIAQPGTLTGSIGIYGGKFVVAGAIEKLGGRVEEVAHGQHAGMHGLARPYSPEERATLERQLVAFYDQFVEKVAEARRSTPERVDSIAQGRVWTGRQALALGLIDELGGLERAVLRAKQRAKIPIPTDVELVIYPPRRSLYQLVRSPFDLLSRSPAPALATTGFPPAWLPAPDRDALSQASLAWRLFRRGEPLALMPFVFSR
jgi:protease-4